MKNLAEHQLSRQKVSDLLTLKNRIVRLAKRHNGAGKSHNILKGETASECLGSLVEKMDETVLPREITVTVGSESSLTLYVSGRRLMAIANTDAPECDDPENVQEYLRAFFDQSKRFTFGSERWEGVFPGKSNGIAAAALAEPTLEKPRDCANANPIPDFFSDMQSQMVAWVTLTRDGCPLKQGGEPVWKSRLAELAKTELAKLEAQRRQSQSTGDAPGCILLNFGGKDGFTLLYARSETSGFVALLATTCMPDIQASWADRAA